MLTRLGRDYKRSSRHAIGSAANLEQAREDQEEILEQAEKGQRKSMMATGAGMALANKSAVSGALGLGSSAVPAGAGSAGSSAAYGLAGKTMATAGGTTAGTTSVASLGTAVPVIGAGLVAGYLLSRLF